MRYQFGWIFMGLLVGGCADDSALLTPAPPSGQESTMDSDVGEGGDGEDTPLDGVGQGVDSTPLQGDSESASDVAEGNETPGDAGPVDSAGPGDSAGPDFAACEDQLTPPLEWFAEEGSEVLVGALEWGQTHVIQTDEERSAPEVGAERETLVLLTPNPPLLESADVRIAAWDGAILLGVVPMAAPYDIPSSLEEGLTPVSLDAYSDEAWSAMLPWSWVRSGVSLRIGAMEGGELRVLEHAFEGLASPHEFTVTRTHMVLFGEEDFPVIPVRSTSKIAADFGASVPGAEFRWVNTTPWRLDAMVVNTVEGPRWVASETERLEKTSDPNRWNILKHQTALRLSLANTGRGLRLTSPPEGDSSPYSFGTSMAQGWVRTGDGHYTDINDAGLAAGWTGWSGMWLDECGNGFIHEVGHSFTLAHFTGGTAANWGIGAEYPKDGTNVEGHPWGFDTTRRQFRTWYRVNGEGPVTTDGNVEGKNDPMNGGESPNAITCFPQYTGYHGQKIQQWLQNSPTLKTVDGVAGVYRWNVEGGEYVKEDAPVGNQEPIAVGIPVVTLIGTLGNLDEVCQTYPPIYAVSGNVFELPDPSNPDLEGTYAGSQWFVEVVYEEGSLERGLINRGAIAPEDTGLAIYSLNLDATRNPVEVRLYRSESAYPAMDVESAELIHTRVIGPSETAMVPVVRVGRGYVANHDLSLKSWCETGVNCDTRAVTSSFHEGMAVLSFGLTGQENDPVFCSEDGEFSVWNVPVFTDSGESETMVIHAQRVVADGDNTLSVPAEDRTPWSANVNGSQTLRVWIPFEENQGLAPARYRSDGAQSIALWKDGIVDGALELFVDLEVRSFESIEVPPNYMSAGLSIPEEDSDSSIYYVFEDSSVGPTSGAWWGDGAGTLIQVPVRDVENSEVKTLVMRAHKVACGNWWGINTGQAAEWGCSHQVHLQVEEGANASLISGHVYETPASSPILIRGLRWHAPNAGSTLGVLNLHISHQAP